MAINNIKRSVHRLLLVDDQPILREGFAHLLDQEQDLKVCGQADSAAGALKAITALRPDLVTVDVVLKGMNGIELVKQIRALHPMLPVLVLSMLDEVLFAERALRAGAKGYVMKQAPTEEVKGAIRRLLRGGRSCRAGHREPERQGIGGLPAYRERVRDASDCAAAEAQRQDDRNVPGAHQREVEAGQRDGTDPHGGGDCERAAKEFVASMFRGFAERV